MRKMTGIRGKCSTVKLQSHIRLSKGEERVGKYSMSAATVEAESTLIKSIQRRRRIFHGSRSFCQNFYRRGTAHVCRRNTSVPVSRIHVNARFKLVVYNEKMLSTTWILNTKS